MFNTLLPVIDVIIELPEVVGKDGLGNDIVEYNSETVEGCLVIGKSSSDLNFPADKIDSTYIRVDLPKSFTKNVSNGRVLYLDRVFEIVGAPVPNPYSPLPWNRHFLAEGVI